MCALLLRHGAARRLGGSMLRRAQPAVAEERRRLGTRLMHTEEEAQEETARRIQLKKEELYDVISKAQQKFLTSRFENKRLLKHLALHVNARPEDSRWRRLHFSRKASIALDITGFIAAIGSAVYFVVQIARD